MTDWLTSIEAVNKIRRDVGGNPCLSEQMVTVLRYLQREIPDAMLCDCEDEYGRKKCICDRCRLIEVLKTGKLD
jgi:hypothetical protein